MIPLLCSLCAVGRRATWTRSMWASTVSEMGSRSRPVTNRTPLEHNVPRSSLWGSLAEMGRQDVRTQASHPPLPTDAQPARIACDAQADPAKPMAEAQTAPEQLSLPCRAHRWQLFAMLARHCAFAPSHGAWGAPASTSLYLSRDSCNAIAKTFRSDGVAVGRLWTSILTRFGWFTDFLSPHSHCNRHRLVGRLRCFLSKERKTDNAASISRAGLVA